MLIQLYQKFQEWSRDGAIWVYSDPHFDDADCKIMDPNWITPQEQVNIINSKVGKNDTLILLGDIGNIEWIRKFKAKYKILIAGNHDKGLTNYERKKIIEIYDAEEYGQNEKLLRQELMKKYPGYKISINLTYEFHSPFVRFIATIDNNLFDEVYGGPLFISDKILLSHEPINLPYAYNIHGHKHDLAGGQYDDLHFNVCSNCIGYTPINLRSVISAGALSNIENIHRLTIDEAIKKSNSLKS